MVWSLMCYFSSGRGRDRTGSGRAKLPFQTTEPRPCGPGNPPALSLSWKPLAGETDDAIALAQSVNASLDAEINNGTRLGAVQIIPRPAILRVVEL